MPAYRTVLKWLMRGPLTSVEMAYGGIVNSSAHIYEARKHGADIRATCLNRQRGLWEYRLVGKPKCEHGKHLLDACRPCRRLAAR
jgi:hypothetical protein